MSTVQVRCPTCQTLLRPTATLTSGCMIRCPSCQTAFKVSLPQPVQAASRAHVEPPPRNRRPAFSETRGRRARQYDDDEPAPSSNARVWILAVVAVLALVIGGVV